MKFFVVKGWCVAVLLGLAGVALGDDRKEIVGTWSGAMPKDREGSIELTITPEMIRGRNALTGRSLGEGSYDIDPAKKTLDASKLAVFGRAKLYRGVYSLNGNTLQWCATSRPNRPAGLEHKPGSEQYLMVLRRKR